MLPTEYGPAWYNWISWFTDAVSTLAKEASDMSYEMEDMMNEHGMTKMEPDFKLLVKLFILSEAMEDEEFKSIVENLKSNYSDVWEIRHKPWLDTRWGIEDEDEEEC